MTEKSANLSSISKKIKRSHLDAIVIAVLCLLLWLYAAESDLFEILTEFMETHEDWELDEIAVALTIAGLGGFVFGIRRYWERERELVLRKKAEQRAVWLAQHDPLTQLPNRRYLREFSEKIRNADPAIEDVAVMAVDLDGFKKVNDLLGHDAGDELLKVIARRLSASFQDSTVIRLGGDEFLVVTTPSDVSVSKGHHAVHDLIKLLNKPVDLFGVNMEVGASVGISVSSGKAETLDHLIRTADAALYNAKRSGRNSAAVFEPFMLDNLSERAAKQASVRHALENNKLAGYFQPIVDLATGTFVSAEILTRWPENKDTSITAEEMIRFAEELGLILPLSEHLLRQAIRAVEDWPSELSLSFNLGPSMLADKGLARRLETILLETDFAPQRLTVEISEHALQLQQDTAGKLLAELSALGVRIALDSFGKGHCNLARLTKLPFDQIKLDRSLLLEAETGSLGLSVFETYFNFAHALELPIVAVGVETEDQQQQLKEMGCEFAQGFLYAPAISQDKFATFLLDAQDGSLPPVSAINNA